MDHAEARTRLMDLALEPARMRGFDRDVSAGSSELREHLDTCAECRAELSAWRKTVAALDTAVRSTPAAGDVPGSSLAELAATAGVAALPAGLRARTLASVAAGQRTGTTDPRVAFPRRARSLPVWLGLAAAFVLMFASAAFVVVDRTRQLDQARADAAALTDVTATLDRILQDPGHQVAQLTTLAGAPAGSVSWSAPEATVVVLTGALQSPPAGQVYRCWIAHGGSSVAVGEMHFSGSTAYWAGSLDSWGATFAPGGHFWVSLEPIGGGSNGTRVLVGNL